MDNAISAVRNTCFAILSAIESDLRNLIGYAALKDGNVDILPDDVRLAASQRFASDNKDRPGVTPENDLDLLDYTDFADLAKMIRSRGNLLKTEYSFEPAPIATEIERMAQARNRVCHSRPLDEDDLPRFLDLSALLLREYKSLPWESLRKFHDAKEKDPTFVLRLQIPAFWQAGTRSIPHNIPFPDFDETSFLGRMNERRDLRKHILGPHPVVTIVGEGGVGKTALAIQCLYDILDADPQPFDAIVFLSLRTKTLTPSGVAEIRDSITETIGLMQTAIARVGALPPQDDTFEVLNNELLEYMREFRILLVIDNYETLSSNSIRPLLSSVPRGSKVLITSRIGLGELELRYKLDPLDSKTAVHLARKFARSLNLEMLAAAPQAKLEKYTNSLYRNPLLIKWFVQSTANGADPDKVAAKRGPAFESALRFCFENMFSRLSPEEREILNFLAAAHRALTFTELMFLLHEVYRMEQSQLEIALTVLHNSSMLKRMPLDSRRVDAVAQIVLTDVSADYIARFAPPEPKVIDRVQRALKKLQKLVESQAVRQAAYKYELYTIRAHTRDERICAALLAGALESLRASDFDSARQKVNKAKDLLPTFSEAYRISALVEGRAGDLYKAEEELKVALQNDPTSVVTRYQYALFLLDAMEDPQRALAELEPAIELDHDDESLQTLYAMILTRLGRCQDATVIYESILASIRNRPRKWRISTYDQAAECLRRLSEQDRAMKDECSGKDHLNRAFALIEEAVASQDFDSRTNSLLASIFEDSIFLAIHTKDEAYAQDQMKRMHDALHVLGRASLRRLTIEHLSKAFGEDSEVMHNARDLTDRISWATRREDLGADSSSQNPQTRDSGSIKALPPGVLYGFIIDSSGQDWFFHRNLMKRPELWTSLSVGTPVEFKGLLDPHGRRRAKDVEILPDNDFA